MILCLGGWFFMGKVDKGKLWTKGNFCEMLQVKTCFWFPFFYIES